MTASASEIVFIPYERTYELGFEDEARRLPDLATIQRIIGCRPTLDLPRMLESIIAYYRMALAQPGIEERPARALSARQAARKPYGPWLMMG